MAGTDPGGPGGGSDHGEGGESPVYRDRAVYLPAADALVLADLHLGRDATSNVELPMGEREDLTDRLRALVERFDPAEVVVGGDLLHAFDEVPRGVPETLDALRGIVRGAGAEFVAVRGNHDVMLGSVFDGTLHDAYRLADGGTVVIHGEESPDARDGAGPADVARYVIGHDHPAIEVEGRRRPCYLLGRGVYRRSDVLVLPAFNRLAAGTVVNGANGRDLLSPLVTNLDAFRPIVRDPEADQTLRFPPLGRFRDLL